MLKTLSSLFILTLLWAGLSVAQPVVNYDIVYVRAVRAGDQTVTNLPEVKDPISFDPGADLMLLHPDGTEEVLVASDGKSSMADPVVSFDGRWVYYAKFHDQSSTGINSQRGLSRAGSDIYKINLQSRQIVQLTRQVWTPSTGTANWSSNHLSPSPAGTSYLGYGIFNLGPCELPGGKLMFTSSRNGYLPNKGYTNPNLQLFVMDDLDSAAIQAGLDPTERNVELVGHLNLGSALHPTILMDGRVIFSSYEGQGLRDSRIWGLWAIWPDGRKWEPVMSAFTDAQAFHFQGQLSNGTIAFTEYYNQNNNGYGTVLGVPPSPPPGVPPFGDPNPGDQTNPAVRMGIWYFQPGHPSHLQPRYNRYSFSPKGLFALTGYAHGQDGPTSHSPDGGWEGKATHPSGAPNNDLLLAHSTGPSNHQYQYFPVYDSGIYLLKSGAPVNNSSGLVLVKNDPGYNELQPKAVVNYQAIYGIPEPARLAYLPNNGSETLQLPAGTPLGLVGTSSFYKRNVKPGKGVARFAGLDPFNTSENGASTNWTIQGAEAGLYQDSDIYAVRVLTMEPTVHRSYPRNIEGYRNHAHERLRIIGEVPLRKVDSQGNVIRDPEGNPDTSFLAKIPADVPFTFQTIDKNGMVLNMSQTWHQVRPGETRNDCGGCHAHAQNGLSFSSTAAAKPDYVIRDLTKTTPMLSKDSNGNTIVVDRPYKTVDVEYYRDIRPILQRSCVPCHTKNDPNVPAGLVLDDTQIVNSVENTYNRLANDGNAQYGYKPLVSYASQPLWRQTNASRYIRQFQSRRSLLIWKIFGQRLDGWTNADHPTETVPGDPATLPAGAQINDADIDFTGTMMPPPGSNVPPLTADEKMTFARWIDLGCPVTIDDAEIKANNWGWHMDALRPTVALAEPKAGLNTPSLRLIRIGLFDYYSGLNLSSMSLKADFPVNGKAAGQELAADLRETSENVWTLLLSQAITDLPEGTLTFSISDNQGNINKIVRKFSVRNAPRPRAPNDLKGELKAGGA